MSACNLGRKRKRERERERGLVHDVESLWSIADLNPHYSSAFFSSRAGRGATIATDRSAVSPRRWRRARGKRNPPVRTTSRFCITASHRPSPTSPRSVRMVISGSSDGLPSAFTLELADQRDKRKRASSVLAALSASAFYKSRGFVSFCEV